MEKFGHSINTKEGLVETKEMFWTVIIVFSVIGFLSVCAICFSEYIEPKKHPKTGIQLRDSLLIENYKLQNEILKKQLDE